MATAEKPLIELSDALVMDPVAASDWLVVSPLILSFIFGALCLMMRKDVARQSRIAIVGLAAMLAADIGIFVQVVENGSAVMAMGRWLPPFGITFIADMTGAIFALATGIVGLAVGIYALRDIGDTERRYGFYPFLLLMLGGVTSAFLTGDIFNLYVWFEVLLIGSFGLLVLGSTKEQLDGSIKYAFLNLIATTLFLIGVAYLYGLYGTLNMADIARKSSEMSEIGPRVTLASLFFFAFAMKAAAFPLNFWLPASYHTPRIAVSAVFAGLLTKVGVYALFRIFLTLFPADRAEIALIIAVVASLTMVIGAIGALGQSDIRRALGYIVISGIGMMLAGLALGSHAGITGGVFYAFHSMIVMTALYLLIGMAGTQMGTFDLHQGGGLYSARPVLSALALVLIFSASGLPPFSGLWPKLYLVKASIDVGIWWLAASILLAGFLTTIALGRIFALCFWREKKAEDDADDVAMPALPNLSLYSTMALAAISVIIGIYPEPVIGVSGIAADQLLSPANYIDAVFGLVAEAGGRQ